MSTDALHRLCFVNRLDGRRVRPFARADIA